MKLTDILFLDIETVPQYPTWSKVPKEMKALWTKKFEKGLAEGETLAQSWQKAGLYAEYGKIVCISIGAAYRKEGNLMFKTDSFYGDDEVKLLEDFKATGERFYEHNMVRTMCGHNGKSFDFPWIARRMVITGVLLPEFLNIAGKKPWEIRLLDTMDEWKFGDMKHYMSLNTLTYVLGVPSPKDDIDGSRVADVYYKEKDVDRIAKYCEKDVVATAKVYCKMKQIEMFIDPEPLLEAK